MLGGLSYANFNYNKYARIKYNFPFLPVLTSITEDDSGKDGKKSRVYNFIADAIEKVAPSVVYIEGTLHRKNSNKQNLKKNPSNSSTKVEKVSGSGFVVSENGIILTSAHVISNVVSVKVKFSNEEKRYDGYVIDADHETDLAAIKITNSEVKFPAVKLGKYSEVRVGEWVAALGSPLGLSNTVTSGIVSTLDRQCSELGMDDKATHYIQTDAAINVGNSGGPLINLDGEVIGVNCITIYPASGISFAVPSDVVSKFLEEAIKIEKSFNQGGTATQKYPKRERFFIGISMLTLTPPILHEFQTRNPESFDSIKSGVLVARVNSKSPADRCGLNVGDIIISVNDICIKSSSDIFTEVQKGEMMEMKVQRGQKTLSLYVKPEIISRL